MLSTEPPDAAARYAPPDADPLADRCEPSLGVAQPQDFGEEPGPPSLGAALPDALRSDEQDAEPDETPPAREKGLHVSAWGECTLDFAQFIRKTTPFDLSALVLYQLQRIDAQWVTQHTITTAMRAYFTHADVKMDVPSPHTITDALRKLVVDGRVGVRDTVKYGVQYQLKLDRKIKPLAAYKIKPLVAYGVQVRDGDEVVDTYMVGGDEAKNHDEALKRLPTPDAKECQMYQVPRGASARVKELLRAETQIVNKFGLQLLSGAEERCRRAIRLGRQKLDQANWRIHVSIYDGIRKKRWEGHVVRD